MIITVNKSGRVADACQRDTGTVVHLVETEHSPRGEYGYIHEGWKPALCGTVPGKRGRGWSATPESATCERCKKKLEKKSKESINEIS